MKKYHDYKIEKRNFSYGDVVLSFKSRLCLIPVKLKSKWTGPSRVTQVFPHRAVDIEEMGGTRFKVKEQMIKVHLGKSESVQELIEDYYLHEV